MTELETHLLIAFENMQSEQETQFKVFQEAYEGLQSMFDITSKENATLRQQVSHLSEQVNALSSQLQKLGKYYSTKKP